LIKTSYSKSGLTDSFPFYVAEKSPKDKTLAGLCNSLTKLSDVSPAKLDKWLERMILGAPLSTSATGESVSVPASKSTPAAAVAAVKAAEASLTDDDLNSIQENRQLLHSLTKFIIKENG
jgi:hypothetical protein